MNKKEIEEENDFEKLLYEFLNDCDAEVVNDSEEKEMTSEKGEDDEEKRHGSSSQNVVYHGIANGVKPFSPGQRFRREFRQQP